MPDTTITMQWENESKTIMRITYPAGYTVKNYLKMLADVLEMIEGNSATIVYINQFLEGARMPEGDVISAVNRMTKTFSIEAMILWNETSLEEVYNRAIVKSFGFKEGKNVWFVCTEGSALTLADELDAQLNSQIQLESKEQPD